MPVNQEDVNGEAKLQIHRIIAPRLRREPDVLEQARAKIARLEGQASDWVFAWRAILALPPGDVARKSTEVSAEMERLRSASPFDLPEFMDPSLRRRIWSKARRRLGVPPGRPWRGQAR